MQKQQYNAKQDFEIKLFSCVHIYIVFMRTHYTCVHIIVDGSEDADEIHCLKDGEDATLAPPAITDATRKLLQEIESDEEDQFASLGEEGRELEQNELLIDTDSD